MRLTVMAAVPSELLGFEKGVGQIDKQTQRHDAGERIVKNHGGRDCHKRGKVGRPLASPQDDFCLEAPFVVAASASLCRFYEDVGRSVSNSYSLESTFTGAEMDRCSVWRAEPIHVG
jgi:hypothetical protein